MRVLLVFFWCVSLSKQRLNPPGADLNSQRLARRVKAMDGLHKSNSSMKDETIGFAPAQEQKRTHP